jgi:membrane-associated phospholipid phosphatase
VAISSIYIIQDFFTHESLYDISANWTVRIQNSGSSGLKFFMQFASNGSLAIMGACISYLLFAYPDRARIFSLIWYFATCTWLMSYLKLLYSDPRPYMSYVKIEGMECAPEYGNPSGHSFLNCFFYLVFPWVIYPRIFHFVERRESETGSGYETHFNWGRIAVVFSMIGWILLIGYSRIYLGVHSINQVLLGFVIGTLTASIFILEVSEKSDKFFTKITNASKELKHKYLLIYFAPIAAFIIIATNVTYVIVMQVYPLTESPSLGYIINIDLTKSC